MKLITELLVCNEPLEVPCVISGLFQESLKSGISDTLLLPDRLYYARFNGLELLQFDV